MRYFTALMLIFWCACAQKPLPEAPPATDSNSDAKPTYIPKPFPNDDVPMAYVPTHGPSYGFTFDLDSCWLGGPFNTVALVRVESDIRSVSNSDGDCSTDERAYATGYWEFEATVLRAFPKDGLGFEETIAPKILSLINDRPEIIAPGDHFLISLREAGGEWFGHDSIGVEITQGVDTTPQQGVFLPSKWSELVMELGQVQSTFQQSCPNDYSKGELGWKTMDDTDYDEFVHTPYHPEICNPGVIPETNAGSGTTVTDG